LKFPKIGGFETNCFVFTLNQKEIPWNTHIGKQKFALQIGTIF